MNPNRQVPDTARAPARSSRRRASALAAAIAASAALAIAGCGGSSPTTTTTTRGAGSARTISPDAAAGSGPNSPGSQANSLRFAKCMRSHGVPNFPDPKSDGQLTIEGTGINTNSPAFQNASKACQSLIGGEVGSPSGQKSALPVAQQLALAKCMRAHGVSNFPDPNASGAIPPGSINLNSPLVRRAFQTCQPASQSGPPSTP